MSKSIISVLIVDDSTFMRKALKRMLATDDSIKVIGEAKDGREAIELVKQLKPDVVTLDVQMHGMDGLTALEIIMRENPVPVIMVSSLTSEGGETTIKALEMGALDFIDKSSCESTMDIQKIAGILTQKIKAIAGIATQKIVESKSSHLMDTIPEFIHSPSTLPPAGTDTTPSHLVAIGASTGGPTALEKIFAALPRDYSGAILVVQHMPIGFTKSLAERMNDLCLLKVKEAEEGDPILPGNIYIAPGGYHMRIKSGTSKFFISLNKEPHDVPFCPSVDEMMFAVAKVWPGRMLGIVLTGMGQDGMEGTQKMKQRGATIIAQNEETCVVFGMPKAAYMTGCVDRLVAINQVASEICRFR